MNATPLIHYGTLPLGILAEWARMTVCWGATFVTSITHTPTPSCPGVIKDGYVVVRHVWLWEARNKMWDHLNMVAQHPLTNYLTYTATILPLAWAWSLQQASSKIAGGWWIVRGWVGISLSFKGMWQPHPSSSSLAYTTHVGPHLKSPATQSLKQLTLLPLICISHSAWYI